MKLVAQLLARKSVQGILIIAGAIAVLGCCCPSIPLPVTEIQQQLNGEQIEQVPIEVLAGPAAVS
jgi:hypothetical protein